jgi:hypothetical protein
MEKHKLQAATYKVPRNISGPLSFNIIRIVKSRKLRWVGKVPNMEIKGIHVDI